MRNKTRSAANKVYSINLRPRIITSKLLPQFSRIRTTHAKPRAGVAITPNISVPTMLCIANSNGTRQNGRASEALWEVSVTEVDLPVPGASVTLGSLALGWHRNSTVFCAFPLIKRVLMISHNLSAGRRPDRQSESKGCPSTRPWVLRSGLRCSLRQFKEDSVLITSNVTWS